MKTGCCEILARSLQKSLSRWHSRKDLRNCYPRAYLLEATIPNRRNTKYEDPEVRTSQNSNRATISIGSTGMEGRGKESERWRGGIKSKDLGITARTSAFILRDETGSCWKGSWAKDTIRVEQDHWLLLITDHGGQGRSKINTCLEKAKMTQKTCVEPSTDLAPTSPFLTKGEMLSFLKIIVWTFLQTHTQSRQEVTTNNPKRPNLPLWQPRLWYWIVGHEQKL